MAESSSAHDVSVREELEYTRASNVNVSNFVSAKLYGRSNYEIWNAQMVCLMESQNMGGIVKHRYDSPAAKSSKIIKQYNNLLKGWILGSLDEKVAKEFVCDSGVSAKDLWRNLKYSYGQRERSAGVSSPEYEEEIETTTTITEHNEKAKLMVKLPNLAQKGHWSKAKSILKKHKDAATEVIGDNGDTMLHLAVREGKNNFVEMLLTFKDDEIEIEKQNSNGQTALHIAAIVGNKYAAELLVKKREKLLYIPDHESHVPLVSAYSNMQFKTFAYLLEAIATADGYLSINKDSFHMLITGLIYRKQYDLAWKLDNMYDNYAIPTFEVLMAITRNFPTEISFCEALIYPSKKNMHQKLAKRSSLLYYSFRYLYTRAEDTLWEMRRFKDNWYSWLLPEIVIILLVPIGILYPIYQLIHLLIVLVLIFPFFMLYSIMWKVLAFVEPIKHIEKKKKEYEAAKILLYNLIKNMDFSHTYYYEYKYIILEALRHDVYEVVRPILRNLDRNIDYTNEGHNVIQFAVLNRSEKVYKYIICPILKRKESYRVKRDSSYNNLLHLAGKLAPPCVLSRTTGAALQLQRELQFREEVEKIMEPAQLTEVNADNETPEMVFTREHANLVKEGEQWMKTTAESCSITAALIVTIVFAAAITVPGGNNQDTGLPLFKNEVAFIIFAVCDATSLFTAATSLIVFLSILTARFSEKDFLVSLPRRLIIGLCLLSLSTTAMMVAFSAVLFLVFCDQRPWMLAPIGGLTCLPILAIVTLQLPLVVDLYQSTYSPVLGKKKSY